MPSAIRMMLALLALSLLAASCGNDDDDLSTSTDAEDTTRADSPQDSTEDDSSPGTGEVDPPQETIEADPPPDSTEDGSTEQATELDSPAQSTEDDSSSAGSPTGLLDGAIACEGQHEGKSVSISSAIYGDPVAEFVAAYGPLAECTGVEIVWEGSDQFATELNVRLEGGNPADILAYPQPGFFAGHARAGYLQEFPQDLVDTALNDFIGGWDTYGTIDGKVYGIPGGSNIKSLVWYSPSAFAEGGYEIPQSIEDLYTLSQQIVDDGGIPWCVGAESGAATGWVLTDWMEDFMLRTHGGEVYDQWVDHEIAFNDPRVLEVAEAVGAFVKNPAFLGGENLVKAIATTSFLDGGLPILDGNCYMHRQASFYAAIWPEGTTIGDDGDVNLFYLPSPADGPRYMLGGGDIFAATNDKPETFDVIRYTASAEFQTQMANAIGQLSPHLAINLDDIADPFTRKLSELQLNADVFRFDASDLMPGEVGAGTFWTEATAWVIGGSTEDFLNNVEASWPSS